MVDRSGGKACRVGNREVGRAGGRGGGTAAKGKLEKGNRRAGGIGREGGCAAVSGRRVVLADVLDVIIDKWSR